jgi:hypothetical protein
VGGALFGGIAYALTFLILPDVWPSIQNLLVIGPALAGISLGRNPNGAVNETARSIKAALAARAKRAETPEPPPLDLLGLEGFTEADRTMLDHEVGLDDEPLYAPLRPLTGAHREAVTHG